MPTPTAERREAARRAGWTRTGFRDAWAVSRTVAASMAPGTGRRYRVLVAWCRPAAVLTALLTPLYHRVQDDGGLVCVALARPHSSRRTFVLGVAAFPVVAFGLGTLAEVAYWPVLITGAVLQLYALGVSACQGVRDRSERPVPERWGPVRGPALTQHGWSVGRIRADETARGAAVPAIGDLLDAVVPAGDAVHAYARSDREQADLALLGFAEPRGEHGPMVLIAPTTRG
ncbi:hypothetical protein [Cellulomonas pakistanensis]|uniref:Uncharacterized protein n=1 Tax=Cellulomonas pakistanensis TaxID=992287 RepID=A0A919PB10_9CELL|nr:hypothetical protein [Cellulomonas pakistanensis]GIG34952.1 hypothetical protein Cpa01nite_03330 [Cellulomonas pakistanensis]